MPQVAPTQDVACIDSACPFACRESSTPSDTCNRNQADLLSGLVDLLDQMPGELLTIDNETYTSLIYSKAHIKEMFAASTLYQARTLL